MRAGVGVIRCTQRGAIHGEKTQPFDVQPKLTAYGQAYNTQKRKMPFSLN
jgi:hypothetical protein